jgi:transcriptional regulator with GAF, ATPase, and Fis domain
MTKPPFRKSLEKEIAKAGPMRKCLLSLASRAGMPSFPGNCPPSPPGSGFFPKENRGIGRQVSLAGGIMGEKAISLELGESDILRELSETCDGLFRLLGSPELVDRIVGTCIMLTRSDRGTLFLATQDGHTYNENYLTSRFASGLDTGVIQIASSAGIAGSVFTRGQPLVVNNAEEDARFAKRVDRDTGYRTRSVLAVPIRATNGRNLGVIQVLNSQRGGYSDTDLRVVQVIATFAAMAFEQNEILGSLDEVKEKLELSKSSAERKLDPMLMSSRNTQLAEVYDKLPIFARSDSSILIEGESGSGKEMVAQFLHKFSSRSRGEFVAINCAAIPESLFEAELFGVLKGAATGTAARKGKIELADNGTLFLDEIGEMPLSMQAKLLRALQDRAVSPLGSEARPRKVNFRVVSATNRNLAELVQAGKFREDLFYRLNVVRFRLPPLRERMGDLPALCEAILRHLAEARNLRRKTMSAAALQGLGQHSWPGNIRELQNKLESALITSGERPVLEAGDFSLEQPLRAQQPGGDLLRQLGIATYDLKEARARFDEELIQRAISASQGNKTKAARLLGLSREGLRLAMKKK